MCLVPAKTSSNRAFHQISISLAFSGVMGGRNVRIGYGGETIQDAWREAKAGRRLWCSGGWNRIGEVSSDSEEDDILGEFMAYWAG